MNAEWTIIVGSCGGRCEAEGRDLGEIKCTRGLGQYYQHLDFCTVSHIHSRLVGEK